MPLRLTLALALAVILQEPDSDTLSESIGDDEEGQIGNSPRPPLRRRSGRPSEGLWPPPETDTVAADVATLIGGL
jgi:hypothetical protein